MFEPEEKAGAEPEAPGYRERLRDAFSAAQDLFSTRAEIFGQEAAEKAGYLGRGLAAFAAALVAGWLAMLLLAALLVALFTLLFGQVWAGILATLVLYGGACAAAVVFGWKALSKVRPLDFPVTGAELARDWDAVSRSLQAESEEAVSGDGGRPRAPDRGGPHPEYSADDVEARYREGAE
ncbi:MAG TPA: phage holin family protein [Thermoanaerobaculia bacterium]|jgi:hypothetical protein|nr:phage holin family protein [Thermoanaerobaculia bacterium]